MRTAQKSPVWVLFLGTLCVLLGQGCSGMTSRKAAPPPVVTAPPPVEPQAQNETPLPEEKKVEQVGVASWYGPAHQGKTTASGEPFNQNEFTAAHPTLPLGTETVVTDLKTGKSVKVTINDRGPYVKGRKIDLSRAAAQRLGMTGKGVTKVKIQATLPRKSKKRARRYTATQHRARNASRVDLTTRPGQ